MCPLPWPPWHTWLWSTGCADDAAAHSCSMRARHRKSWSTSIFYNSLSKKLLDKGNGATRLENLDMLVQIWPKMRKIQEMRFYTQHAKKCENRIRTGLIHSLGGFKLSFWLLYYMYLQPSKFRYKLERRSKIKLTDRFFFNASPPPNRAPLDFLTQTPRPISIKVMVTVFLIFPQIVWSKCGEFQDGNFKTLIIKIHEKRRYLDCFLCRSSSGGSFYSMPTMRYVNNSEKSCDRCRAFAFDGPYGVANEKIVLYAPGYR